MTDHEKDLQLQRDIVAEQTYAVLRSIRGQLWVVLAVLGFIAGIVLVSAPRAHAAECSQPPCFKAPSGEPMPFPTDTPEKCGCAGLKSECDEPPTTAGEGLSFTPPPGPYPDVHTLKECRCVKDCPCQTSLCNDRVHYPEYECRDITIPARIGPWLDKD